MSIATVSAGRASKLVKQFPLSFAAVDDPRVPHLTRYSLRGILNLVVAGFASGKETLRDIEAFVLDLTGRARRQLGLGSKHHPCDTTIYNLLKRLAPEALRATLYEQVGRAIKTRRLRNDLMPRGVAAFDGKGGIDDWGYAPNTQCRQTVCDWFGTPMWFLYSLRVHLVSCSSRPCLDQEFINNESWETTTFLGLLRRVAAAFPNLFEIVTGDAIFPSRENAQAVLDLNKHYVFGLKRNQRRLHRLAIAALDDKPVELERSERYRGMEVVRQLYRVDCPEGVGFPGARQFLAVAQWRIRRDGSTSSQCRLFITSMDRHEAGGTELLKIVRLHWGIENNGNWTLDRIFDDDQRCPCKQGNGGAVISWLRLLTFNAVAFFRASLPTHDRGRPVPWRRVTELIWMSFFRFGIGARRGS